jgi:putative phosphoserine phosphatase/1-acylglycerol-3-phosphate O-acyltransferase
MTELTTSAAVREVEAAPEGPEIGAFFDLDGTLVEGFTARLFLEARMRNRDVGAGEVVHAVRLGASALAGRAGFDELIEAGAQATRGKRDADVKALADWVFIEKTSPRLDVGMRHLVDTHRARGHTVVLASSATNYQVEPVARALGIDHVVCNHIAVDDEGLLTGEVARPVIWGDRKALAIRDLAEPLGIDLRASYFYADGAEDEALMHLVGHPRPVNPQARLAAVAKRRGWPVLRTPTTRPPGTNERIRSALGLSSLIPAAGAGLTAGLLRRSKRAGINIAGEMWLDSMLRWSEVKVRVVAGRRFLESPRPAVFIFNHRNNFDPFIVASVVRRDFTGVAKKELARDPIMGTVGRLADLVFIDRDNPREAVKQLQDMEILVQKGLSVIIAPEGTRSPDGELGPFKKGPFRIAMATGLPIIPIVVRNAEVIGDRDATVMRAGTVDVAVLAPIPVEDWTRANLDEKIQDARNLFVETLLRWPG